MDRAGSLARVVSVLAVALALAWGPALSTAADAQQVIKIAAGVPLTGPLAKQGQEVANAVKLAVEQWNAKGGVLGKKIEVLEADDQGNPQVGVAAAEKVAADPAVMGAVWGITSVTCIPVSEVLDKVNVTLISPGCTNPKVTDRGLKTVNRVCARDDAQGPAGAMFAVQDLKAKKIAIFDDGTTGPKGVADEVEKTAKKLGAQPFRYVIRSGDKDFRAILGHHAQGRRRDLREPLGAGRGPDRQAAARRRARRPHDRARWPCTSRWTTSRPRAARPRATT